MQVKTLLRKINNIFARGKLLSLDISTKVPRAKVGLLAKEIYENLEYAQDYGIKSLPPNKIGEGEDEVNYSVEALAAFLGGNRDHGTILRLFIRALVPDDLEPGEVVLYSVFGTMIKLNKDGEIVITNENVTFTIGDGKVTIDGDLEVTGTINGVTIPPE